MNDDSVNKMIRLVQDRLNNGESRESIIKLLVDTGMNPDTANDFVNAIPVEKKPNVIRSFFFSVIILAIGFLVLNGALYVGQELWYMNDVDKCEAMETKLNDKKNKMAEIKIFIDSKDNEYNKLKQLKKDIENGLSQDISKYDKLVKLYNNSFYDYKQKRKKYNSLIDEHNKLVYKYNDLAKSAYSRWWLLPIPFPGGKSH